MFDFLEGASSFVASVDVLDSVQMVNAHYASGVEFFDGLHIFEFFTLEIGIEIEINGERPASAAFGFFLADSSVYPALLNISLPEFFLHAIFLKI